jgi:flagellar biosynthesis protein FlhB
MANDSSGEKTEQPSAKRLREARKKGEAAKSTELAGAASFLATIAAMMALLPHSARQLADLSLAVDRAFESLSKPTLLNLVMESLWLMAHLSFLPVLVAALVYTGMLWLQVGTIFSLEPVKPKLDNVNPVKGFQKVFSLKSVVNFVLMLLKLLVVCLAVVLVCRQILPDAIRVIHADISAALAVARTALVHLVMWCGAAFVALGAADLAYQRWQFIKDKKMTIQEVRRELKEDEGDPHIKAERRRMAHDAGPLEQMQYMHLASLVLTDLDQRLLVFIYRPKQFKQPLFLLRSPGGAMSQQVLAAARQHDVKIVQDPELLDKLFVMGNTGAQLAAEHAGPVMRYLGVRTR